MEDMNRKACTLRGSPRGEEKRLGERKEGARLVLEA